MRYTTFFITRIFLVAIAVAGAVQAQVSNGKIAFVSDRDGNFEIYVMNPDGTDQTRLTFTPENESYPTWSPDGSALAFLRQATQGLTLNLMDENGGNIRTIPNVFCDPGSVDWSPDGQKLVFVSSSEIHTINIDGSNERILTGHSTFDRNPSWSPNGSTIIFSRSGALVGSNGIYQVNSNGGDAVASLVHAFLYSGFDDPVWTPDGTNFIFTLPSQGDLGPNDTIALTTGNGAVQAYIYTGGHTVAGPKYSADGREIVFAQTNTGSTYGIFQIRLMNRTLTDLSSSNFQPDWQPLRPNVSVSGRVTTPSGMGLRNAVVVLTDDSGSRRSVTTSSFGLYEIQDVRPGMTYIVSVASKRYRFQSRSVTSNENVTGLDFIGLE
jgi:Tol biopolymer transport system component